MPVHDWTRVRAGIYHDFHNAWIMHLKETLARRAWVLAGHPFSRVSFVDSLACGMTNTNRAFAIIPAAGESARMGAPKLRLPWRGRTIIEHTIDVWKTSGVDRVLVVVRAGDVELAATVRQSGATDVRADPPPPDMKASIQAGLKYAEVHETPSADDVWLTAPADLPALSSEVIRRLLVAHDAAPEQVLVAGHQGRFGHPVLFPWPYARKVAELADGEGLNRLVERSGAVIIECGEGALCVDLDTPDDYERWQEAARLDGR